MSVGHVGYTIIFLLFCFHGVYSSGEQCTTGWLYEHCYDNYKYIGGFWRHLDECCKMNGTWYCVSDADLHPCKQRGFTTTTAKSTTIQQTTRQWQPWQPWQPTTYMPAERTTRTSSGFGRTTSHKSNSVGVAVGVAVGVIVLISVTSLVVCIVCIQRKRRNMNQGTAAQRQSRTNIPPSGGNPVYFLQDSASGYTAANYQPSSYTHSAVKQEFSGLPPSYEDLIGGKLGEPENTYSQLQNGNDTASNVSNVPNLS